ncbi:MAG: 3'(2'),5'-bisphosphate nucleotidase [Cyanobacteria bacterium QS_8_64_29]|nr:MAG: 3'(2'),5'-bisphosphate nucleotidase [Cyanobacteria bacterium QS_8_64_29]
MAYESEREAAIEACRAASRLCERVRAEMAPDAMEKQDRSPVTVADFGSQAVICQALAEAFPQDAVVAEEDAAALRRPDGAASLQQVTHYVQAIVPTAHAEAVASWIDRGNGSVGPRYWTLDPIDGTKGFLRGDQYAITLALVEGGEVKVGVLGCPSLSVDAGPLAGETGLLFAAVRHQGATMEPLAGGSPHPIGVATQDASKLRFVEGVEPAHSDHTQQAELAQRVGITAPSLRVDSQAKYGTVACGQAALYLRLPPPQNPGYRENVWDHAAGTIVVEEAGGRVTDMHGRALDFTQGAKLERNQGVIVSNGALHDAVLQALREQQQAVSG